VVQGLVLPRPRDVRGGEQCGIPWGAYAKDSPSSHVHFAPAQLSFPMLIETCNTHVEHGIVLMCSCSRYDL
jgi:hypothetical protein